MSALTFYCPVEKVGLLRYLGSFFFATNKNSIMDKLTKLWLGFSMVSYTPSLQEYGSALIYNIALKETKALLVPKNKYTEEDLPTVQLPYSSVPNQE